MRARVVAAFRGWHPPVEALIAATDEIMRTGDLRRADAPDLARWAGDADRRCRSRDESGRRTGRVAGARRRDAARPASRAVVRIDRTRVGGRGVAAAAARRAHRGAGGAGTTRGNSRRSARSAAGSAIVSFPYSCRSSPASSSGNAARCAARRPKRRDATVPATAPANCVMRGDPRLPDPRGKTHEFPRNAACGHASVTHSRNRT